MGSAELSRAPGNLELAIYAVVLLGKEEIGIARSCGLWPARTGSKRFRGK